MHRQLDLVARDLDEVDAVQAVARGDQLASVDRGRSHAHGTVTVTAWLLSVSTSA
jgi:hypothetical protein